MGQAVHSSAPAAKGGDAPSSSRVNLQAVSKVYETASGTPLTAVSDVDFQVDAGEIVSLLGPSGCGKTTLLNIVAGFEVASSGSVTVDDVEVEGPAPHRGVVFQEAALFPWLTCEDNVAFGPRARGMPRGEVASAVRSLLEVVGLDGFAGAYPRELSGGMRQRVAIARVLVNRPTLMLLDEPFGALDAQTRLQMQEYLVQIEELFPTTMILITHDIDEALYVSDRVAVMSARPGRIIEVLKIDTPRPRHRDFLTSTEFTNLKRRAIDLLNSDSASSEG